MFLLHSRVKLQEIAAVVQERGLNTLVSIAMPIICIFVVIPTTDQLWSASDALCAGTHDFVSILDPAGAAVWSEVPVSNTKKDTR